MVLNLKIFLLGDPPNAVSLYELKTGFAVTLLPILILKMHFFVLTCQCFMLPIIFWYEMLHKYDI